MPMSGTYATINGQILSETRGGVERHYVADTLESTAALIDNSGSVTDRMEFWPYREELSRTGSTPTPFTYVGVLGYYREVVDKLEYVRAREYRPEGRIAWE